MVKGKKEKLNRATQSFLEISCLPIYMKGSVPFKENFKSKLHSKNIEKIQLKVNSEKSYRDIWYPHSSSKVEKLLFK